MSVRTAFGALAVAMMVGGSAFAAPGSDNRDYPTIYQALAFEGKLWLTMPSRSGDNGLWTQSLTSGERTEMLAGVTAMAKANGHMWVMGVTAPKGWLREWRNGAFLPAHDFKMVKNERPLALAIAGDAAVVVTTRDVHVWDRAGWHTTKLTRNPWRGGPFGAMSGGAPAQGGAVYVGMDRGEWGGGMVRVDLATGVTDEVKQTPDRLAKEGPEYDRLFDDIHTIIPDPARRDCVIAAAGEVHYESSGRILRICGLYSQVIFEHRMTQNMYGNQVAVSEAFFDLTPTRDGYWAAGITGLYKFTGAPQPQRVELPRMDWWHDLCLSRAIKGTILLASDASRAHAMNGGEPLIVSLD